MVKTNSASINNDQAKKLFKIAGETFTGFAFADTDGDGLEFMEIVPVLSKFIFEGIREFGSGSAFKEALNQVVGANAEGRASFIKNFADAFQLKNSAKESVIERFLTYLNDGTKLYVDFKEAFKKPEETKEQVIKNRYVCRIVKGMFKRHSLAYITTCFVSLICLFFIYCVINDK